ncbi:MAG: VWA domain-containing protein [Vicinamibacterales bacterium]
MKRALLASVIAAGTAAALMAQDSSPVFRSGVEFVTLDVTVLDRQGLPVRNLKPADFTIEIDKKVQPVDAIEFIEFATSTAASRSAPIPQPQTAATVGPGRSVLIAVDDLSFSKLDAKPLTDAAARWVAHLSPNDLVGVMTTSGFEPNVAFSHDRRDVLAALRGRVPGQKPSVLESAQITIQDALRGAIEKAEWERCAVADDPLKCAEGLPSGQSAVAQIVECIKDSGPALMSVCVARATADIKEIGFFADVNTASQIDAYTHLVRQLARAPSPRVLVLISDGVGLDSGTGYASVFRRAADEAGVQVFALTWGVGMVPSLNAEHRTPTADKTRRENNLFLKDGLAQVVDNVGGRTFRVPLDPEVFLDRMLTGMSGFYRLGVRVPPPSMNQPVLAIKASVRGSGMLVRTANRIARSNVPDPPDVRPLSERLSDLVRSGDARNDIPVELATNLRRDASGGLVQVTTTVRVPATVVGPFTAAVAVVNDVDGSIRRGFPSVESQPGQEARAVFSLAVPTGRYRLRIAVADGAGHVGTSEQAVLARLQPLGDFYASDLTLLWSRGDGQWQRAGFHDLPAGATGLSASLELYAPNGALLPTAVHVAVTRDGDDQARLERDVTPAWTLTSAAVLADLPLVALDPGAYVVKATVLSGDKVIGVVSAAFRLTGPPTP